MKGGLAQLVVSLGTIRELGLETSLVPVVFVNADEEIGSRTSTRYIRMLARLVNRALVLEPALGLHLEVVRRFPASGLLLARRRS